MLETLVELRKKVVIGFVGGSDLKKQVEQLGDSGKDKILREKNRKGQGVNLMEGSLMMTICLYVLLFFIPLTFKIQRS